MIKFPSLHIAESVKNRILNTADELDADEAERAAPVVAPSLPASNASGQAIDVALATPPGEVSAPPNLDLQTVVGPGSIL